MKQRNNVNIKTCAHLGNIISMQPEIAVCFVEKDETSSPILYFFMLLLCNFGNYSANNLNIQMNIKSSKTAFYKSLIKFIKRMRLKRLINLRPMVITSM